MSRSKLILIAFRAGLGGGEAGRQTAFYKVFPRGLIISSFNYIIKTTRMGAMLTSSQTMREQGKRQQRHRNRNKGSGQNDHCCGEAVYCWKVVILHTDTTSSLLDKQQNYGRTRFQNRFEIKFNHGSSSLGALRYLLPK